MADTRRAKDLTTESKKPQLESLNSPSRRALRSFFSCRYNKDSDDSKRKKSNKIRCTGSLCHIKDSNNPNVMQRAETNSGGVSKRRASISGSCYVSKSLSLNSASTLTAAPSSSSSCSSVGGSSRVMHLRRLSGCYGCQFVVDPINGVMRDSSSMRATIFTCDDCGEIFVKAESLELHQLVRHAVSELGPEDTSRNIVEIIFQSSWLKKQTPVCKIDRILKVHNTKKTIGSFEDYRDCIKSKASNLLKKHPRCVADGNELLRFYCTTFTCSLGLHGCTNLCDLIPHCKVCSIIRDGIKIDSLGRIQTLATSGRAHDSVQTCLDGEKRAMLVCRVIAGRVKKSREASLDDFDSVAGSVGVYSDLDELFVFNPRAILPCFVVIYRDF